MSTSAPDDDKEFRLVFPGNIMPGSDFDETVFALARLLKTTPDSAIKLVSGVRRYVKRTFSYKKADQLRTQVLRIGVECELEPIDEHAESSKLKKRKRKKHFPKPENFAMKPATADENDESAGVDRAYSDTMAEFQKHAIEKRKDKTGDVKMDDAALSFNAEKSQGVERDADGEALKNQRRRLAQFIGENMSKYLPKFDKFQRERESHFVFTWHWPALFVPFLWAIYRKLWGWSLVILLSSVVWPFSNILWAAVANYIYYRHSVKKIKSIRYRYPEEVDEKLSAKGGTSVLAIFGIFLIILLLMNAVYWSNALSPVFTTLSENLDKLEQMKSTVK